MLGGIPGMVVAVASPGTVAAIGAFAGTGCGCGGGIGHAAAFPLIYVVHGSVGAWLHGSGVGAFALAFACSALPELALADTLSPVNTGTGLLLSLLTAPVAFGVEMSMGIASLAMLVL